MRFHGSNVLYQKCRRDIQQLPGEARQALLQQLISTVSRVFLRGSAVLAVVFYRSCAAAICALAQIAPCQQDPVRKKLCLAVTALVISAPETGGVPGLLGNSGAVGLNVFVRSDLSADMAPRLQVLLVYRPKSLWRY